MLLGQEKETKFYTGYAPKEVMSEMNVAMASITQTNFPLIEIIESKGGHSSFIRGTRGMVGTIIEYLLMGESPETIVGKVLPHLTLAQVHNAILYYSAFKNQVDQERRENTEDAGRKYLQEKLGEEEYRKLTGE